MSKLVSELVSKPVGEQIEDSLCLTLVTPTQNTMSTCRIPPLPSPLPTTTSVQTADLHVKHDPKAISLNLRVKPEETIVLQSPAIKPEYARCNQA